MRSDKQDVINNNSRSKKRKLRECQLPDVSPLVYSRFLIESAVFLSLNDMGKNLHDYEEIPLPLSLCSEVKEEYNRVEKVRIDVMRTDKKIGHKILSKYLNLLSTYPDQPYGAEPIIHPIDKQPIIIPKDTTKIDDLSEKDLIVLDIVEQKVKNDERVLIYTN